LLVGPDNPPSVVQLARRKQLVMATIGDAEIPTYTGDQLLLKKKGSAASKLKKEITSEESRPRSFGGVYQLAD